MRCFLLAAAAVLFLTSCSTPMVARASFDGRGAMAFDGDQWALVTDGDVTADLSIKGSLTPLPGYRVIKTGGVAHVASISGEWSETSRLDEELSKGAEATIFALFSPAQLELLDAILSAQRAPPGEPAHGPSP